jgi:hypothetical protein
VDSHPPLGGGSPAGSQLATLTTEVKSEPSSLAQWLARQPIALACLVPVTWLLAMVFLPFVPDIVATAVSVSLVFVLPGLALLYLVPARWTLVESFLVALLLGFGLASLLSLPALLIHLPIIWVALPHLAATAVIVFFATRAPRATIDVTRTSALVMAGLFLVTLFAALVSGDERLRRSVDDWHDLAYTASYFAGDDINAEDPNIGQGVDITSRRAFNVIGIHQALAAHVGDIDVVDLGLKHYQLLATCLTALGAFALAARLGGNERAGIFAVVLLAAIALTDLQTTEGYGRGVLLRASDDKFFASLILLPAFILLALTYRRGPLQLALISLGALSVSLMHPFGVAFIGIVVAGLVIGAFWRWRTEPGAQSWRELVDAGKLSVVALVPAAIPAFYQRFLFDEEFSDRFGGENQVGLDHRRVSLPLDFVTLDWSMLTHPLLWIAIVATPLVIWRLKDVRHKSLIAVLMLALPAALFFPPTATVLGKLGSPGLLWRFVVIIPFAPVLALMFSQLRWTTTYQALAVSALAISAFGLKEALAEINSGYYGDRYNRPVVVSGLEDAWTKDTDRADTRALRAAQVDNFVSQIDELIVGDALILLPPRVGLEKRTTPYNVDIALPAEETELKSYTSGGYGQVTEVPWEPGEFAGPILGSGHIGFRKRSLFATALYSDSLPTMVPIEDILETKGITHIVVLKAGPLYERVEASDAFSFVGNLGTGRYRLYSFVGSEE